MQQSNNNIDDRLCGFRGEWVVAIYMYLRLSYHTILGNKVKQVKNLINLHLKFFY